MWLFRLHVWVVPQRELVFAHFHPDKHKNLHLNYLRDSEKKKILFVYYDYGLKFVNNIQ